LDNKFGRSLPDTDRLCSVSSPLDLYRRMLNRLNRYNYHGIENVRPCFLLARLYFDCLDFVKTVASCQPDGNTNEVVREVILARDLAGTMAGTIDRLRPLLPDLIARRHQGEIESSDDFSFQGTEEFHALVDRLGQAFNYTQDGSNVGEHLATHLAASYGESLGFVLRTDNMLAGKMAAEDYIIEVMAGVGKHLSWHLGNCEDQDGDGFCTGVLTWSTVFLEGKGSEREAGQPPQ